MKRSLFTILVLLVSIFSALLAGQATVTAAGAQTSTQSAPPSPAVQAPAQAPKSAAPVPAANEASDSIPRRYVELWNTGNLDQMETLFAPPVVMLSRGNHVLLTFEMLRRVITAWRKSMPDLHFKIEETIKEGDNVAMRLSFTGSYKERLFAATAAPTPEIPRTIRATEMLMFHLKDGKINQICEEYDELRMRVEMGGSWRTNQEQDAMSGQASTPGTETPAAAPSPKP